MFSCVFNVKLSENNSVVVDGSFNGSLNDNCIIFNDGVNNIFDLNKLVLERSCDDYKIILDFSNLSCKYIVDGFSMDMSIDVIDKNVCSNSLFLKYLMIETGNIYEYSIVW